MKNEIRFTADQMAALKPYERHFTQARDAHFCSPLWDSDTDILLGIWKEVTGKERIGFRRACASCTFHLVQDLSVLYFAQIARDAEKKAEEMPVKVPAIAVESKTPAKVSNTTKKGVKAASKKKKK